MQYLKYVFRYLIPIILVMFCSVSAWSTRSVFSETECWFDIKELVDVRCGLLEVPQNHFKPENKNFVLPVLRIGSNDHKNPRPPILYLSGGPGETSLLSSYSEVEWWHSFADKALNGRQLVVVELRGAPESKPSLDCVAMHDPAIVYGVSAIESAKTPSKPSADQAELSCIARLRNEGIDLEAVNRRQIAYDIKALVNSLGLEQVSLFGVSYGTTYAMTIASEFPELVSDLVLDSVYPPEATDNINHTLVLRQVIENYFSACKRETSCNQAFPDLGKKFFDIIRKLSISPVQVNYKNSVTGILEKVEMDDVFYIRAIRNAMMAPINVNWMPYIIYNSDDIENEFTKYIANLSVNNLVFYRMSHGAYFSSLCYDLPANFDIRKSALASDDAELFVKAELEVWQFDACNRWSNSRADAPMRERLNSKIPTLILAGGFDPVTPPYLARMAAAGLERAHLFVFPNGTHALSFYDDCAVKLISTFWTDTEQRPNDDCFVPVQEIKFETDF